MKIRQAQASFFGDDGPAAAQPIVGTDPGFVSGLGVGAGPNPASHPTAGGRIRNGRAPEKPPSQAAAAPGLFVASAGRRSSDAPLLRQDRRLSVPPFRPPTRRFTDTPTRRPAAAAGISRRLDRPVLGGVKVKFKARRASRAAIAREKGSKTFWGAALRPILGPRRAKACACAAGCAEGRDKTGNNRVGRPRTKTRPKAPSRFPSA